MINVPRETSQRFPDVCKPVFHVKHLMTRKADGAEHRVFLCAL